MNNRLNEILREIKALEKNVHEGSSARKRNSSIRYANGKSSSRKRSFACRRPFPMGY